MTRDVRGVVSRLRSDLRLAAAERYREALAEQTSDVRWFQAAAAGFDRVAGAKRMLAQAPTSTTEVADITVALARRLRRRDALLVTSAAVSGAAELSIGLGGSPGAGARVRGLSLVRAAAAIPLDVLVSHTDGAVRLVATLPEDLFPAEDSTWRVAVTDDSAVVPVVTPSRDVLAARWAPSVHWPPRVELDPERRLCVTGWSAQPRGVEHSVALGLTSAVVEWDAPSGEAAELRLVGTADQPALTVPGAPGPDGVRRATVDLAALADGVWDASIRAVDGAWRPLELAPGRYPALASPAEVGEVRVRRGDGAAVRVRIGYSDRNRLRIEIGGRP